MTRAWGEGNVDQDSQVRLRLIGWGFFVYFEGSIQIFSAVGTRLLFPHDEFVDVLHTFSGKMADIAEQAEYVWCLNSSETLLFVVLPKNDSNYDGKNFVRF